MEPAALFTLKHVVRTLEDVVNGEKTKDQQGGDFTNL